MKLKKVKIQAFRAYDKVKDSTFDFTTNQKDQADFISLYAPNGFGKTSFYDAVEFAITRNISRFVRKSDEHAKHQRNASKEERQYILRNRFSAQALESFVEVSTTDPRNYKEIIKKPRKNGKDFRFSEENTIRRYFREVVLSQEWIDAFLMQDNAEERYRTFIDYFGDKKLDEYYRKVTELRRTNDKEIDGLKKSLKEVMPFLNFSGDKKILVRVNVQINKLNREGEIIKEVRNSFSDEESLALKDLISKRIIVNRSLVEQADHRSEKIDNILLGKETINPEHYFELLKRLGELEKNGRELQLSLKSAEEKRMLELMHTADSKQLKEMLAQKDKLEQFLPQFLTYLLKLNEQESLTKEIRRVEKERASGKKLLDKSLEKESILKAELMRLATASADLEIELREGEVMNKLINAKVKEQIKLEKEVSTIRLSEKSVLSAIKAVNRKTEMLEKVLDNLKLNKWPPLSFLKGDVIPSLMILSHTLLQEKDKLTDTDDRINELKGFNSELRAFIKQGAILISQKQEPVCPLCNTEFESYSLLQERVSNNSSVSKALKILLAERDTIQQNIEGINRNIERNKQKVKQVARVLLAKEKNGLETLNVRSQKSKEKLAEVMSMQEVIETELTSYKSKLHNLSFAKFKKTVRNSLKAAKVKTGKINFSLKAISTRIDGLRLNENKILAILANLNDAVNVPAKDPVFRSLLSFLPDYFKKTRVTELNYRSALSLITRNIKKITALCESRIDEIRRLEGTLRGVSLKQLQDSIEALTKVERTININIKEFEKSIAILMGKTVVFKPGVLRAVLVKERKTQSRKSRHAEKCIQDLLLLEDLRKNVEPYLKYEKAKKKEHDLKARKEFLELVVERKLLEEKERVATFLNEGINSFFYEQLINDLYLKIDPHPDYKKIRFVCDFEDEKPKLNVCLYLDEKDPYPIIPNLYFSTAQINILSLSIFLAKALNARDDHNKPIDCIFIDDPIQSMDNINVLSTIDLFRSLVHNLKKQIILSTHDKNFHQLLKKKIPSGLFNSKFMELETFGKVKADVG